MAAFSIEDMPMGGDISSREGVSLDYMARVRIAYLMGQNQSMVAQTQFADAKAGALLAFIGLVATRGPGAVTDLSSISWEVAALIVLHASALVCAIVVLYPRYASYDVRKRMATEERFSWPALAADGFAAYEYCDFMRGAQLSQLVASVARSNHALAGILLKKFGWLRAAFAIAAIDVSYMAVRAAFSVL